MYPDHPPGSCSPLPFCGNAVVPALLLAAFLLTPYATAQTPGTCEPARADAYLDVNNVRARIFGNGALFWRGSPHVYEVPKQDSVSALFASGIWLGGLVNNELRVAAARYINYEFWPGPLDNQGTPPADCTRYDHLWEITRDDIASFNATGNASANLIQWPWHLGAPVLDGDGIPGNYNLDGGDRPALMGDQMLWWVMNDVGNLHLNTDTPPIGMEVHGSAFAFTRHSGAFIDHTTFYRYKLIYKGTEPLEAAWIGLFADNDMGYPWDDNVASDTLLHLGYTYNADDEDENYGTPPPAVGYTILKGPRADTDRRDNDRDGLIDEPGERLGMETLACFWKGGGPHGEPITGQEYYRCLRGLWKNGDPIQVGGDGTGSPSSFPGVTGQTTRFLFPGDPVTNSFWSMMNIDGAGTILTSFDTRFSMSSGPFTMQPGDEEEFVFAIVWSRGTDHLDSVRQLKQDTRRIRGAAEAILQPVPISATAPPPEPNHVLGFAQNFPNPFAETTTIRYSLPKQALVRLSVYDVLGREVATLVEARQDKGIYAVDFDGRDVPMGVYFYRLQIDGLRFTRTMMVMR
ncbi:MAG: T9SS type A sorting domain-containing protein [Rhodothermales bacterium]